MHGLSHIVDDVSDVATAVPCNAGVACPPLQAITTHHQRTTSPVSAADTLHGRYNKTTRTSSAFNQFSLLLIWELYHAHSWIFNHREFCRTVRTGNLEAIIRSAAAAAAARQSPLQWPLWWPNCFSLESIVTTTHLILLNHCSLWSWWANTRRVGRQSRCLSRHEVT